MFWWILGCGTSPRGLEMVVEFTDADSEVLASILGTFEISFDEFGLDPLSDTSTL